MKTLAERLDDEERAMDKTEEIRAWIRKAMEQGRRDADAVAKASRGSSNWDPSLDRLRFR